MTQLDIRVGHGKRALGRGGIFRGDLVALEAIGSWWIVFGAGIGACAANRGSTTRVRPIMNGWKRILRPGNAADGVTISAPNAMVAADVQLDIVGWLVTDVEERPIGGLREVIWLAFLVAKDVGVSHF